MLKRYLGALDASHQRVENSCSEHGLEAWCIHLKPRINLPASSKSRRPGKPGMTRRTCHKSILRDPELGHVKLTIIKLITQRQNLYEILKHWVAMYIDDLVKDCGSS